MARLGDCISPTCTRCKRVQGDHAVSSRNTSSSVLSIARNLTDKCHTSQGRTPAEVSNLGTRCHREGCSHGVVVIDHHWVQGQLHCTLLGHGCTQDASGVADKHGHLREACSASRVSSVLHATHLRCRALGSCHDQVSLVLAVLVVHYHHDATLQAHSS